MGTMAAGTRTALATRFAALAHGITALTLGAAVACTGSGGGGAARNASLLAIEFPEVVGGVERISADPPTDATLVQLLRFVFSDVVDAAQLGRSQIQILDRDGIPVGGRFAVSGNVVTFVPRLPRRELVQDADGNVLDDADSGLQPNTDYTVRLGSSTWSFVSGVAPDLLARFPDPSDPRGVALGFRTTGDPARFLAGLPDRSPNRLSTSPTDGAAEVGPGLYSDPDHLFPERTTFQIVFDGPIHPGEQLERFLLVDLDDTTSGPSSGLPLGVDVRIVDNDVERTVVEIEASGILPFSHLLSLEQPASLRGLSQTDDGVDTTSVAATFVVASAPDAVVDRLEEDFDTTARQDLDGTLLDVGEIPARWDAGNSNVLEASFAFEGSGVLGRFAPAALDEFHTVVLDTDRMVFPLLDGSTPDAPPGYEVVGGVFHFTDIDIPRKTILEIRGNNPLVLTATGTVKVAGRFRMAGDNGTSENAFDSGVTSVPGGKGGPGGGRGGVGHPILYWPPGVIGNLNLVSPPFGGPGQGPGSSGEIGGGGGQSGISDASPFGTDQEIDCNELGSNDNGSKAAGGSGGSFLTVGSQGRNGAGNVLVDGQGGYRLRTNKGDGKGWDVLVPGAIGRSPFQDGDADNDFIGVRGELKQIQGGQGGGGGGTRTEAYYCGFWCKIDADSSNDSLCKGGEFGGAFADSVGDARGGGGGGGGGAILVQALGGIELTKSAEFQFNGGSGGGGETLGRSNWGGPAGGGSGGAVMLQSATSILVDAEAEIDVRGGSGGGAGIVQLQVPAGRTADVEDPAAIKPTASWVDKDNLFNPAPFSPVSAVVSKWWDLGRVTQRAPAGTNPRFSFRGTNEFGFVRTDDEGNVLDPFQSDLRCDYLGQEDPLRPGQYVKGEEPRAHFVPPNSTVQVLFQGADPVVPGSKEVDPASVTAWSPDPSVADTMQFLRTKIVFDITADGSPLSAEIRRPAVQWTSVRADF